MAYFTFLLITIFILVLLVDALWWTPRPARGSGDRSRARGLTWTPAAPHAAGVRIVVFYVRVVARERHAALIELAFLDSEGEILLSTLAWTTSRTARKPSIANTPCVEPDRAPRAPRLETLSLVLADVCEDAYVLTADAARQRALLPRQVLSRARRVQGLSPYLTSDLLDGAVRGRGTPARTVDDLGDAAFIARRILRLHCGGDPRAASTTAVGRPRSASA